MESSYSTQSQSHNSNSDEGSEETSRSCILNWRCTKPTRKLLFKAGGGLPDEGKHYDVGVDSRFQVVYTAIARQLDLRPSDIRMYHRGNYIGPNHSPFQKGLVDNDVIFVYGEDGTTPIWVSKNEEPSQEAANKVRFTIRSCQTLDEAYTFYFRKSMLVSDLVKVWACHVGGDPNTVELIHDHKDITTSTTIEAAGVYDGAYIFGIKK